jgi:Leucine-rich repeat (LRR) protein
MRRYIVDFARDSSGNLTTLGQSALNSFNNLFRGNPNIVISEFENWHRTTPGLVEPLNPRIDEQVFDLDPNELLYDGQFTVLRIQEDRLNRKIFYVLDNLNYLDVSTNQIKQLSIGDEVIINREKTSTRYKVLEVSTSDVNPRVRLEKVEGMEAIPVGIGTLKIYSPVIFSKKVKVSIGYNERNVFFLNQ